MSALTTNTPLTAERISRLAVELLARTVVLPRTVTVVPGGEFAGPTGGVVQLRVRQPRQSRIQSTPGDTITFDDLEEASVAVRVNHHYNASALSDEDLSLNLEDFGAQVLEPMVAAVAQGAENEIAYAMNNLDVDLTISTDGKDIVAKVLAAREMLGRADVPTGDRWLAVSPEVATMLLGVDKLTAVDASGSPSALRDAVIGRIYGFNVVETSALTEFTAVAYHRSAFGAAFRAPAATAGATSSVASVGGISLRTVRSFDVSRLSEMVAVSTFAGAAVVHEDGDHTPLDGGTQRFRAVKLGPDGGSS